MKKVPFPIKQDGKEKGDDHDRGSNHRDSSARKEGIKEDAWHGEASCPLANIDREN